MGDHQLALIPGEAVEGVFLTDGSCVAFILIGEDYLPYLAASASSLAPFKLSLKSVAT